MKSNEYVNPGSAGELQPRPLLPEAMGGVTEPVTQPRVGDPAVPEWNFIEQSLHQTPVLSSAVLGWIHMSPSVPPDLVDTCDVDLPAEPQEGVQHVQVYGELDLKVSDLPGFVSNIHCNIHVFASIKVQRKQKLSLPPPPRPPH